MKYLLYFSSFILYILLPSCEKDPSEGSSFLASVNVINALAINPNPDIRVNFTGRQVYYSEVRPHLYTENDGKNNANGGIAYGVMTGIDLPLKVVRFVDTSTLIYNNTIRFVAGDIYTLFMAGNSNLIDPILVKENFPRHTDSTTGVRFINLCTNSPELSINLVGSANGSEVASLSYKEITAFKNYPAKASDISYGFEVRDVSTDAVLATYTYNNLARMGNVTLLIRGMVGGPVPFNVVRVTNY